MSINKVMCKVAYHDFFELILINLSSNYCNIIFLVAPVEIEQRPNTQFSQNTKNNCEDCTNRNPLTTTTGI